MKKLLLTIIACAGLAAARAQQTSEQFNIPVNYLLYLPDGYAADTARQWPLMIFLHGSGESGSDIEKVKVHGPPKLIEAGRKFPCVVVSPQRGPSMRGWEPDLMMKFINDLKTRYRVDRTRVYLTGLSMGGYGTWNIAMKYPIEFAAIVPICGGGEIESIGRLRNTPVWCFHGAKDEVVKIQNSTRLIDTLKKINPKVKFTVYPEAGHDSWTETYNNDSLYSWLFAQQRPVYARNALAEGTVKEYTGKFTTRGTDTIDLELSGQKLIVKQQPNIELIPFEKDKFFISEGDAQVEIGFVRDANGRITRFVLYADDDQVFTKIK